MDFQFKIKLKGKKLFQTNSVKYLHVGIDKQLIWGDHINDDKAKQSQGLTNCMHDDQRERNMHAKRLSCA